MSELTSAEYSLIEEDDLDFDAALAIELVCLDAMMDNGAQHQLQDGWPQQQQAS